MVENRRWRTVIFYKDYFADFFVRQRVKVQEKIIWTLDLIEEQERVPEIYLKHVEGTAGLYEIRVKTGTDGIRIFCFFDRGQLVILANGFHKQSRKTPKREIEYALKIKREYEHERKQDQDTRPV